MTSSTAGVALTRLADAIDTEDWTALAALLAPGFTARYSHTGEVFDAGAFVALNRDYPGRWRFGAEVVVDGGAAAALRARVTDAEGVSDEPHYVASFGTVDAEGLLTSLEEVWADVVSPPLGERRPEPLSVATPSVAPMQHSHHFIDYFEISVADVATAKRFYSEAFGWSFNDYGDEYAGIKSPQGDAEVGGLAVGRETGPGGVQVLVYSQDLDASVAAVEASGGTVLEPPYDYPGGRRFFFADPSGNKLGVYQPSDA